MPRFAANLAYLFTEHPPMERFGAAAAAGFAAVELHFPMSSRRPPVREQLARHALAMLGINTPPAVAAGGAFGLAAVPGREAEFASLFRRALDYAVAIGGRQIHCMSGVVAPELRPAANATLIRNLVRAADTAAGHDITLLIEPINPRDRPDYFLTRAQHAADIIAQVDRRNVRMQFDFYHAQIVGGDLLRRFEKYFAIVGHVQVAAVPTRHEPDEGEVNYPEIFAALDRLGYQGFVGAEYRPRGRTEDGLAWARPYGVIPRGG